MNNFKQTWNEINAEQRYLDPMIYMLYDHIKGRNPKGSAFTPITNKIKLANGQKEWQGYNNAFAQLKYLIRIMESEQTQCGSNVKIAKRMLGSSSMDVQTIKDRAGIK